MMAKLFTQGVRVAREAVEQSPETRAVVHLHRVAQFVEDDVVGQVFGEQHQRTGEVDVAPCRATAPTSLAGVYLQAVEGQSGLCRQAGDALREHFLGACAQGFLDDSFQPELLVAEVRVRRAQQGEVAPLVAQLEAGVSSALKGEADEGGVEGIVPIDGMHVELLQALLRVTAVFGDEFPQPLSAHARRDGDCDRAVGKDAQDDVAGARVEADVDRAQFRVVDVITFWHSGGKLSEIPRDGRALPEVCSTGACRKPLPDTVL